MKHQRIEAPPPRVRGGTRGSVARGLIVAVPASLLLWTVAGGILIHVL